MSGWLILAALAVAVGVILWRKTSLDHGGKYMAGAAVCLALAGYAAQGRPSLPAAAAQPAAKVRAEAGDVSRFLTTRLGPDGETLGYAKAWMKAGRPDLAARTINIGLKKGAKNPDLWVALGGAIVAAADGMVTPAATFAFARARSLRADHPAPDFFDGLAAAQANKLPETAQIWLSLYDRTPENALWRADLEMRLSALAQAVGSVPKAGSTIPD